MTKMSFNIKENKRAFKHFKRGGAEIKYTTDEKGRRRFIFDCLESDENDIKKKKNRENNNRGNSNNIVNKYTGIYHDFKCDKCDMVFNDNLSLQEHLNGKIHNKTIGNSMNIKNSSLKSIKNKLAEVKEIREKMKSKQQSKNTTKEQ